MTDYNFEHKKSFLERNKENINKFFIGGVGALSIYIISVIVGWCMAGQLMYLISSGNTDSSIIGLIVRFMALSGFVSVFLSIMVLYFIGNFVFSGRGDA